MSDHPITDALQEPFRAYVGLVGDEGYLIGGFVALLWIVELGNLVMAHALSRGLGIVPRTARGVLGIVLSPLLHSGPRHAFANTPPFVVLATLVVLQDPGGLVSVSAAVVLLGGLGAWSVGRRDAVYVGASGLVFGYLGYVLVRGFSGGSPLALLIAIAVFIHYRFMLPGMLPWRVAPGVSWEGHLLGAAAGAVTALHVSGVIVV